MGGQAIQATDTTGGIRITYSGFTLRYLVAYGEKSFKSLQIKQIFLQQFHFVYDASLWGSVLKVYLKDLNRFVRFDFPFGRRAKPSVTK